MKEETPISVLDPKFKWEVLSRNPGTAVTACFYCGTCTAGCPIHLVFSEYDPRKIIRMINLGMKHELLSSPYIWYCATCHNCEESCPQNVKFFQVLNVLKNMAAEKGYSPPSWISQFTQVLRTGLVFPAEESWLKKREELSLPVLLKDGTNAAKLIGEIAANKIKLNKSRNE